MNFLKQAHIIADKTATWWRKRSSSTHTHTYNKHAMKEIPLSSPGGVAGVKALDVSNMEVILRGKQWDRAEDPCAKSVIHLLERNEGLVTWLQPKVDICPPACHHMMMLTASSNIALACHMMMLTASSNIGRRRRRPSPCH
jgi:hypothetical protein